jgi:hypothetical protein
MQTVLVRIHFNGSMKLDQAVSFVDPGLTLAVKMLKVKGFEQETRPQSVK